MLLETGLLRVFQFYARARGPHACRSSEFLAGYGIVGKRTATQVFLKTFYRVCRWRGGGREEMVYIFKNAEFAVRRRHHNLFQIFPDQPVP